MPKRKDIKKVMVIGSGPIVIGQAAEFDYAGTQACLALKEEGYEVILCNSNPATIMTDTSIADKVYMEPLTLEYVAKIVRHERPDAIVPGIGGQTGLNLAMQLQKKGVLKECQVELLGTDSESIECAEDREKFKELCNKIGEPVLPSMIANTVEEAVKAAAEIGYPLVLRPAFTLGGTGGGTQTRTNSCALVTTGLSQECNKQDCCSSVYYENGSSCTASCGGGTRNRLAYSNYNHQRCEQHDLSSGGSACNTGSCCDSVYYLDGGTCSAPCDAGTYNRKAYSNITGERCSSKDTSSGGSYCNLGACYVPEPEPEPSPPVYNAQCYAYLNSKSGSKVKFTTTSDDACAINSVSSGCSISSQAAHSFYGQFGAVGSSCSFKIKINGIYKFNGKEHNSISWTTKRTETNKYCTNACCI